MGDSRCFVVVGGGQAGGRAVEALRGAGFDGRLVLLGAEPYRPYQRPPLSKGLLTGAADSEAAFLRPENYYVEQGVELRPGCRATALDPAAHRLTLDDGTTLAYDRLLLATGSRLRRLPVPGADLPGVHYLRDLDDARRLRAALGGAGPVVVIGGGYIGLEVAAAARTCGHAVTVLEAAEGLLRRQVAPALGDWMARLHAAQGVQVCPGAMVRALEGDERVTAVTCADGRRFPAATVVVGVGVVPETALAEAAGLAVDDGILVDACGRTSDPDIFAAGDVTRHPNPVLGRRVRLESWQNAELQAAAAGASMAGRETPYAQVPWFWTDQYDTNLQMLGLPETWDALIWRGDPAEATAFTLFYLQDGRVVGANAVNRGGDIAPARRMLDSGLRPDPAALGDPAVSLKKVLKTAQA